MSSCRSRDRIPTTIESISPASSRGPFSPSNRTIVVIPASLSLPCPFLFLYQPQPLMAVDLCHSPIDVAASHYSHIFLPPTAAHSPPLPIVASPPLPLPHSFPSRMNACPIRD
ncbi:hypothetical protein BHE74_00024805 [Ensete ventricosum]|nr:hypothetical protein BHE74_00024805 [Ensete ventricosum]